MGIIRTGIRFITDTTDTGINHGIYAIITITAIIDRTLTMLAEVSVKVNTRPHIPDRSNAEKAKLSTQERIPEGIQGLLPEADQKIILKERSLIHQGNLAPGAIITGM